MSDKLEDIKKSAINIFTLAGIIVIFFLLLLLFLQIWPNLNERKLAMRVVCGSHIHNLGKTITIYAQDHNDMYPAADKWCDLLMEDKDFNKKILLCSADKAGPCSYAINPNCEPNSQGNVVLLFESKPGWNQNGGAELLNPDNHKDKGCNIIFNDGHIDWIEAKDFNSLKWK